MNRTKMKRKRKDGCSSPLLDDSPKRTKVHAQRKFAQGSNVNSPVITPIKELELERPPLDILPEPVELLPIKRPNTEDFLTFLCFRGTPILPPNLNFFNTASIVDTNGQVHKIKSESPKNGPIDSTMISKCGSSSEKPFIAFGVRKRADPIVISRQMDRKRRHALAIQALRRKYQEQKMAKIRALTISKLSEKVTNRTLVRTNSVSRTETVTKKTNSVQKTQNVKVIATKHVKVTTRTLKTTLRPNIKQKMCLRSFRGRFVQRELPFKNKRNMIVEKKIVKKLSERKLPVRKKFVTEEPDYETEEEEITEPPIRQTRGVKKPTVKQSKKPEEITPKSATGSRVTRSGNVINNKLSAKIQQMKKRILLNTPKTIIKPRRSLRSTTMKKTVISKKQSRIVTKKQLKTKSKEQKEVIVTKINPFRKELRISAEKLKSPKLIEEKNKKDIKPVEVKKETKSNEGKKEVQKSVETRSDSKNLKTAINKTISPPPNTKLTNETKKGNKSVKTNTKETKILDSKKQTKEQISAISEERPKRNLDSKKNVEEERPKRNLDSKKNVQEEERPKRNLDKKSVEEERTRRYLDSKNNVEEGERPKRHLDSKKKMEGEEKSKRNLDSKKNVEEERPKRNFDSKKNVEEERPKRNFDCKKNIEDKPKKHLDCKSNMEIDEIPKRHLEKNVEGEEKSKRNLDIRKKVEEEMSTRHLDGKKKIEEGKLKKNVDDKKIVGNEESPKRNFDGKKNIEDDKTSKINLDGEMNVEGEKFKKQLDSKKIVEEEKLEIKIDVKKCVEERPKRILDDKKHVEVELLRENLQVKMNVEEGDRPKKSLDDENNLQKEEQQSRTNLDTKKNEINDVKEELTDTVKDNVPALQKCTLTGDLEKSASTEVQKKVLPDNKRNVKDRRKSVYIPKKVELEIAVPDKFTSKKTQEDKIVPTEPKEIAEKSTIKIEDKNVVAETKKSTKDILESDKNIAKEVNVEKIDIAKKINKPIRQEVQALIIVEENMKNEVVTALNEKVIDEVVKDDAICQIDNISKYKDNTKITTVTESEIKKSKKEAVKSTAKGNDNDVNRKLDKKETLKRKNDKLDESLIPRISSQRPSRKTKEAAAIYMEILSHKLVNDSTIDDDNVSIDSFPELPNVKKMEQRENELKAKAKSKDDENISEDTSFLLKDKETSEKKKILKKSSMIKKHIDINKTNPDDLSKIESEDISLKSLKESLCKEKNNEKSRDAALKNEYVSKSPKEEEFDKNVMINKIVEEEINVVMGEAKKSQKSIPNIKEDKTEPVKVKKVSLGKRKSDNFEFSENEKDDLIKSKVRKLDTSNKETSVELQLAKPEETFKRQTRNCSQNKYPESDDSDESFYIDVRVPKKKKNTRSKTVKRQSLTDMDESLDKTIKKLDMRIQLDESVSKPIKKQEIKKQVDEIADKATKKQVVSSDSDHSTTSDVDLNTLKNRQKTKKFSKTKSMKKTEVEFSESDDEPLSKLTHKSIDGSQTSTIIKTERPKMKRENKNESKLKESKKEKLLPEQKVIDDEPKIKPKRECAKIPQNYLPMFSSSSEDEYFHGFGKPVQEKCDKPLPKLIEKTCAHLPPSSDLLSKDISRRFGKGKVNMSNEQIEQWLKDSAMAGNSIKKENDEMLKFGERIPTETNLDSPQAFDTQTLKISLLTAETSDIMKIETKVNETTSSSLTTPEKLHSKLESPKYPLDRKLIFKKDKKRNAPNANAFSPENESSVYAFGEDNEPVLSTPFRRPSRRPSSTATSRSEDESAKLEDATKSVGSFLKPSAKQSKDELPDSSQTESEDNHFNIPQNPSKIAKLQKSESPMVPPKTKPLEKCFQKNLRTIDRHLDLIDDLKYKVPSSPSASSSSSAKLYKKPATKPKMRSVEPCTPIHVTEFPKTASPGQLVEAPVFHPSEQEFQDPIEYIERIRHKAEQFGICRIVPPSTFKPECKVQDDMRFTAYNQYIHKMLHRWGPNFKELMAIKKYLETQNISLTQPPWIGGMEIDLPRLYQTVQTLGGLKEVIEKKKWPRVSEFMKIPKTTQDRLTKLDDIYCKYLLPYDTLSPAEREKLFDEVETDWAKRESKSLMRAQQNVANTPENIEELDSDSDDNDIEECIVKGRTMALNAFYRIARNTMSMHFKTTEPTAVEVEQEFWKHVTVRQNHICVHSGSIDSGNWGYGFAVTKNSPFARHAWNLKVFTNNNSSVLRSLGPLMGVTVPTLHVGMVFSACCWYRDPHGLPWIEYLHTGGNKIWYGIPDSNSEKFHTALKKLVPNYCRNKALWLPSDTAMIPPSLLTENNVSLCRTVQEPGQFVVVFPKAFTSSISTGYVVSESVYFAPTYWLKTARSLFDELRKSCEPSMFSLDRLLLSIASDTRSNVDVLRQIIPYVEELCDKEKISRNKLQMYGIKDQEKMPLPEAPNARKRKKLQGEEGDYECETCRMTLFVSMVFDTQGNATYCIDNALDLLENKKIDPEKCKFMFSYDDEELACLTDKIRLAIETKLQKKIPNKYAGMPTLLTK